MRCIYCNTPLAAIDYCPGCGADVTLQKRIVRISNLLYNEGLEKALVRDMEGAITCLKRSLKFNKENIDARNLLGLCYYETGEAVSALCEWVISKNLKGEDNIADSYINELQSNKNRLDTINQTIRKYNQSVLYCREDNEDMAIIQLKKVISQNSKFVKAYQLLALLYMKRQETVRDVADWLEASEKGGEHRYDEYDDSALSAGDRGCDRKEHTGREKALAL